MIILTINGLKNFLTVKKDNLKYTVSLSSYNSILERIGIYKSSPTQTFEIDFRNYLPQDNLFSQHTDRQAEINATKRYLINRLKSSFAMTTDIGEPELRYNKLKLGKELLDLLHTETDNNLARNLCILHEKARELEIIGYGYSYAGGELGKLLVTLLCKYDEDFNKEYQKASTNIAHTRAQAALPYFAVGVAI
jgi:hypothetical protein